MLLLVVAAVLVWYGARLVAVGALVAAPLFAATLEGIVSRAGSDAEPLPPRQERRALAAWAVLCTLAVAVAAPHVADRPGDVPTALDPGLDRLPAGSGVFNAYELGGWLAWRHPDLEQYVDGLITPYSVAHVEGYDRVVTQAPGWYDVVRDCRPAGRARRGGLRAGRRPDERGWVTDGRATATCCSSRPA